MASVQVHAQPSGISSSNELNLTRLVNLALNSSPKVGVVNFNVLKTFLLELLKALNLQHYEPKLNLDDDAETKLVIEDALKYQNNDEALLNVLNSSAASTSGGQQTNNASSSSAAAKSNGISILTSDMKPLTLERFHKLEDKCQRLEQQLAALNSLPSNQQIIDKSKEINRTTASTAGPILEAWQYIQLSKRLESTEEGITKLTSLLQDLIGDMNDLKESQTRTGNDIKKLNENYKTIMELIGELDKLKKYLPSLEHLSKLESDVESLKNKLGDVEKFNEMLERLRSEIKTIETKIVEMVAQPELSNYVTWLALENALKGLKEAIDSTNSKANIPPVQTNQMYTQTITPVPTPTPKPQTPVTTIKRTPPGTPQNPTKELEELLSKLGTLNERHETLKAEVDRLREELAKKEQQQPLSSFKLPDDFAQRLDEIRLIKAGLEDLRNNLNNESNKRAQLENIIANINREIENIKNALKDLLKSSQLNSDEIAGLKEAIRLLEETKADKDWIRAEFERKADKRDLDMKVNRRTFDDHCDQVTSSINDCKHKHSTLEDEWKKGTENIFKELENKLDRLELDSLKDYIEKQMRKLKKLQKDSAAASQAQSGLGGDAVDEAAGLRKQLLRFHCISCDRPVEMVANQTVVPSLPAEKGIRPIQTPRPYTTFELSEIRQFQRQQYNMQDGYDLFATIRQCGGPHTLTLPHKKIQKTTIQGGAGTEEITPINLAAANNLTGSVSASVNGNLNGGNRNEVQIQGQDGQIYKGRIEAKLPIEMKRTVKYANHKAPSSSMTNLNRSATHSAASHHYNHHQHHNHLNQHHQNHSSQSQQSQIANNNNNNNSNDNNNNNSSNNSTTTEQQVVLNN